MRSGQRLDGLEDCRFCGAEFVPEHYGDGSCEACVRLAMAMCAFGLSVRRFARRVEVAKLARAVRIHSHRSALALCDDEGDMYEYAVVEFRTALDRLAALARGDDDA